MKAIKCELCGSNQLIKKDGYYQCEHCCTKYTLEEAKKLIVSGTVEVVDGENKKAKLKKDINTYIQINNFVKAIKIMTEYTDIFPEDPDGYKMKLDFICDHGCCPSFCHLTEKHFINDGAMVRSILYDSEYIFKEFNYNLDILTKLTKIDNRSYYASRLLSTIKSGSTKFHLQHFWHNSCNPQSNINPVYKSVYENQALSKIKDILINGLGDQYGTMAFDEGIKNATEYNKVSKFDDNTGKTFKNCIFLLGNQIISLQELGFYDKEYGYKNDTLNHIPNIKKLKEIAQLSMNRQKSNLCQHCGGEFKGIFSKVCSKCGKPKDYY